MSNNYPEFRNMSGFIVIPLKIYEVNEIDLEFGPWLLF